MTRRRGGVGGDLVIVFAVIVVFGAYWWAIVGLLALYFLVAGTARVAHSIRQRRNHGQP